MKQKLWMRAQRTLARCGVFLHRGTLPEDLVEALETRKNYLVIGFPPRRRTGDE